MRSRPFAGSTVIRHWSPAWPNAERTALQLRRMRQNFRRAYFQCEADDPYDVF